jgi:hypothetical protein
MEDLPFKAKGTWIRRQMPNTMTPIKMESCSIFSHNIKVVKRPNCNKAWRLVSLLWVVFISPQCYGTTILILFGSGNIWIAADSQQTRGTEKRFACKIIKKGQFYWAAASPIYEDPESGFTVTKLVDQIAVGDSLRETMATFIASSKIPIVQELLYVQRFHPDEYPQLMPGGKSHLIKVVFVGVENGQPKAVFTDLTAEIISGEIVIDGAPNEPPGSEGWLEFGASDSAEHYMIHHRSEIPTDPAGLLRDSILAQEKATPNRVGGKVSVMQLTNKGTKWIDTGECR